MRDLGADVVVANPDETVPSGGIKFREEASLMSDGYSQAVSGRGILVEAESWFHPAGSQDVDRDLRMPAGAEDHEGALGGLACVRHAAEASNQGSIQ